ncbi:MAG: phage tail protein, partial [Propionibacteriaceae bacterium]
MSDVNSGVSPIITPGVWQLSAIVKDIADRCGIDATYIDTSKIENIPVRGFVLAQQYTGVECIRALQNTLFFDPAEWDEKIRFVPRGGDVLHTLTIDDMYDDPYEAERKSAIEFPKKLELLYQSSKIGYDAAKAVAERNSPNYRVSGTQTLEVPVVLTEDEAWQVADKQLKVAWAEADGEVNFSISDYYDFLTPTDCVGLFLRDTLRRVRIEKIEKADGVLKITGKNDRQSAYTSNVTGIPLPTPTPPPPTITGKMEFMFLNIPALLDNHDIMGYYVAGTGTSPAYYGGVIERKIDSEEFRTIHQEGVTNTMGYLTHAIASASEHYPDTTNKVLVRLYTGDFESVSQDALLRENNGIAIGRADGTAEILQFRDATDLGDGLFELSYLIRGRLNSGATA